MYDLIIIGGGPAGLTATIYGIRKRLNVLMISKDLGGKTNYSLKLPWIDEYRVIRGLETVKKFQNELEYIDFARVEDLVDDIQKIDEGFEIKTREGKNFKTKALIIATGAKQQFLDIPGEMKFLSKGMCYSAQSYAGLFIDKCTLVIGNDQLALRAAAELAVCASEVNIIGPNEEMMESSYGKKLSGEANVKVFSDHEVVEILGGEFAEKARIKSPDGEEFILEFDGAFIEKALKPNTKFALNLLDLDEQGRIIITNKNHTNVAGIFAAGDVTNIYAEQVLIAIGEGAKAALSACDFLLQVEE